MSEYEIKYIASPISECVKIRTVTANNKVHAVFVLQNKIGRKVDDVISIEEV